MSIHPLAWLSPSRLGGDVQDLVSRGATLARLLVTRSVDDLEGDSATETVPFSYRGADYEIDLSEKRAAALDEALAPYLANARRVRTKPATPRPATPRRSAPRRSAAKSSVPTAGPREVRAWAKNNGIEVSDRGRIAADVMRRYQEAHGG
jgi:nucleoid-associated protein Lsr2